MEVVKSPSMPEAVRQHFAEAVKGAVFDVHKKWHRVFDFDELHQEAWLIAVDRWHLWSDQVKGARIDVRIHLLRWVDFQLPGLGYKRIQIQGVRKWRKVAGETAASHVIGSYEAPQYRVSEWNAESDPLGLTLAPWEWSENATADCSLSLAADWAPMGRGQRIRYARILMRDYPILVMEFLALEDETKPPKLSQTQWARRQESRRGKLRIKYATDLATARYEIEHGRN